MPIGQVTVNASVTGTESSANVMAPTSVPVGHSYSYTLGVGTTSTNADLHWTGQRTVNATSNDDLDLNNVLQGVFSGPLFNAVRICAIQITNLSTTSGDKLIVGAAAANQFFTGLFGASAHTIAVNAGGTWLWSSPVDPATVVAGTADILRVNNPGATPVQYRITLIGRSA